MPIYRFRCKNCNRDEKKLMTGREADAFAGACALCGEPLVRTMSTPATSEKETVDEYRGKSIEANVEQKVAERAHKHWVEHDLPRIIQDQGKEFAIRQGFIDIEGNVIKSASVKKKV